MECWCNNCPRRDDDDVLSSKLSTSRTKQCVQLSKLSRWLRYAWLKLKQVVFANKFWSDKYIHYCSQTTWTTSHQNKSALSKCIVWNEGTPSITVKTHQYTHSETLSTSVENAQIIMIHHWSKFEQFVPEWIVTWPVAALAIGPYLGPCHSARKPNKVKSPLKKIFQYV